jgi:hypothetical protein
MNGTRGTKKTPACRGFLQAGLRGLDRLDVGSLLAFGAGGHFKADALVFLQGLESAGSDLGEVCEEIFAAAIRSNESETLGVVEPLYSTLLHLHSLKKICLLRAAHLIWPTGDMPCLSKSRNYSSTQVLLCYLNPTDWAHITRIRPKSKLYFLRGVFAGMPAPGCSRLPFSIRRDCGVRPRL